MKKILSVFLMSFIVFALSACNADVVKMEDYEWKMRTVKIQTNFQGKFRKRRCLGRENRLSSQRWYDGQLFRRSQNNKKQRDVFPWK